MGRTSAAGRRVRHATVFGRHRRWQARAMPDYSGHHDSHRDVRGGGLRAAVFGISDGLVSNVSLVLGTAGAHPGAGVVRLAGLAGLLGGSFSMAAGEYISMRSQREVFEHELGVEREEIARHPLAERRELEGIYRSRGIDAETARTLSEKLMADPAMALEVHAREELGIDPNELGSPNQAALASFGTFAVGALIPLVAFLGGSSGASAIELSIALTGAAALIVGALLSFITRRGLVYSAFRLLFVCAVAGAVTYGIGSAIGVAGG
ncbi:MAG: VIT1/CCC1 transporter family protein [Acidimicrobiales bacterium]